MVDAEGNREAWKIFLWRGIVKSEKCFWVINLEKGGAGGGGRNHLLRVRVSVGVRVGGYIVIPCDGSYMK